MIHLAARVASPLFCKTVDPSLSFSFPHYWLSKVDTQPRTLTNVPVNSTDFRRTEVVMQNCAWYALRTYVPHPGRDNYNKNRNKQRSFLGQGQNYLQGEPFFIASPWKRLTKLQFSRFVLGKVQQFQTRSCQNQFTSRYRVEISPLYGLGYYGKDNWKHVHQFCESSFQIFHIFSNPFIVLALLQHSCVAGWLLEIFSTNVTVLYLQNLILLGKKRWCCMLLLHFSFGNS